MALKDFLQAPSKCSKRQAPPSRQHPSATAVASAALRSRSATAEISWEVQLRNHKMASFQTGPTPPVGNQLCPPVAIQVVDRMPFGGSGTRTPCLHGLWPGNTHRLTA